MMLNKTLVVWNKKYLTKQSLFFDYKNNKPELISIKILIKSYLSQPQWASANRRYIICSPATLIQLILKNQLTGNILKIHTRIAQRESFSLNRPTSGETIASSKEIINLPNPSSTRPVPCTDMPAKYHSIVHSFLS